MHRTTIFLVAGMLAIVATATAAMDVPEVIAGAPPASAYPDADIVVLYHGETISVTTDGRVTRRVHELRRLQTQWAMRRSSDVRLAWDSARQDLEIVTARTLRPDGTVMPTPPNGTNEVTPDAVARAVPFLDFRELVVSHVGTEPGCVVDLEYVLTDRQPTALSPGGIVWLGGDDPVWRAEIHIEGAGALLFDGGFSATRDLAGGAFAVTGIPSCRGVPQAHRHEIIPHVVWGTTTSTDALGAAVRRETEAAIAPPSDALAAWLATVQDDPEVLTNADLVPRLATLLHDGIAAVSLPAGVWSRAPRSADAVFTTAVGTEWERAVVAMAVLRAAGFEPELGLFSRSGATDDRFITTELFSRLRVVTRIGDRNWWLAPERGEAWTGSSDLVGWTGLFLANDGGQRVYRVPLYRSSCRWIVRMSPTDEGWRAIADLELTGLDSDHESPAEIAASLAGKLLEDGAVDEIDVRHNTNDHIALRFQAHGADLGQWQGGMVRYTFPWPDGHALQGLPRNLDLGRPERFHPVWLDRTTRTEISLTIDLPDGWKLDTPRPGVRNFTAPNLVVSEQCHEDGSTVRNELLIETVAGRIEPENWAVFRTALGAARRMHAAPLVLIDEP